MVKHQIISGPKVLGNMGCFKLTRWREDSFGSTKGDRPADRIEIHNVDSQRTRTEKKGHICGYVFKFPVLVLQPTYCFHRDSRTKLYIVNTSRSLGHHSLASLQ